MSDRKEACDCTDCEDYCMPDAIADLIEAFEARAFERGMADVALDIGADRIEQFYRDRLTKARAELWHAVVAFGRGS